MKLLSVSLIALGIAFGSLADRSVDMSFIDIDGVQVKKSAGDRRVGNFSINEIEEQLKASDLSYRNLSSAGDKSEALDELEEAGRKTAFIVRPGCARVDVVFIEAADGTITLSFKGTSSLDDVATDLLAFPWYNSDLDMRGHNGFMARYAELRPTILKMIASSCARHNTAAEDLTLKITGHSLGGALAQVCAADLAGKGMKSSLITFAAPRALDAATLAEKNVKDMVTALRIEQSADPVPVGISETLSGFKGIGHTVTTTTAGMPHLLGNYKDDMGRGKFSPRKSGSRWYTKARRWFNMNVENPMHKSVHKTVSWMGQKAVSAVTSIRSGWNRLLGRA